MHIRRLKETLCVQNPAGIVLDVVIPSYRTDNEEILERILTLRSSVTVFVKFWVVVDNPLESHIQAVKSLARKLNQEQLKYSSNYFINVIHYGENRGASYARNTGYNYSMADWIVFMDDDIVPTAHILDAYVGAIRRYPKAKVFVGKTALPEASNRWTRMLRTCNVGYFYGIADLMVHPSWGVTANLMVRGARFNPTIQFKDIYPKTGGGEDIDFVYQYKTYYQNLGRSVCVGVPEAVVSHPWWKQGNVCYSQITGWATGDSLCITEWPEKTFLSFPNWIEHVCFGIFPLAILTKRPVAGFVAALAVSVAHHVLLGVKFLGDASRVCKSSDSPQKSFPKWLETLIVAVGAGTILSSQEVTRTISLVRRCSLYSLCRRVDWFDGQKPTLNWIFN